MKEGWKEGGRMGDVYGGRERIKAWKEIIKKYKCKTKLEMEKGS